MNQDDIIRMAKEAGGHIAELPNGDAWVFDEAEQLERFAALVATAERERIWDQIEFILKGVEDAANTPARQRCIEILEHLHTQANGQHNYYLYAAKVLKRAI